MPEKNLYEQIPKLKIVSPNFKFRITNQVSDYENDSGTLIDVKMKLVLGRAQSEVI